MNVPLGGPRCAVHHALFTALPGTSQDRRAPCRRPGQNGPMTAFDRLPLPAEPQTPHDRLRRRVAA
ncbi:hypothetical protein E4A41_08570, partial [Micrococcus endophyticus]